MPDLRGQHHPLLAPLMRLVGIIVLAIDFLLWWKLRKRLIAAFPEKGRKIATGVGIEKKMIST